MLANLADFTDFSLEGWLHALGFHGAMILMAIGLWYWARAVLLATYSLPDSLQGRAMFTSALRGAGARDRIWATRAFDFIPRALCLGTAVVAIIATARSDKWLQAALAAGWGIGLYYLLKYRLVLETRYGFAQTGDGGHKRPSANWWFQRIWQRTLELLDYAPLGRWIAAGSLALAGGLFLLSAVTAFWPHSIEWKTYLAHLLPGPSIALFLLGMCVAPLTALTYAFDVVTFRFRGRDVPLRRIPALVILLALMGGGAVIMNLHALRTIDEPGAMTPDSRASLAVLFKAWAAKCAPGSGPVQPILVAVSGGASRAGLWAARVLDVVDDSVQKSGSQSASIFAVSSVSGGSLGAAAYVAMRAGQSDHPVTGAGCTISPLDADARKARDVAETEAMRADAIGPALAGMMLGDAPRALAAYVAVPGFKAYDAWRNWNVAPENQIQTVPRGNDRAEALEGAFEHNWQVDAIEAMPAGQAVPFGMDRPYLSLFYKNGVPRGDVPLWITNGTDVNTGDRLITVPFKVNAESFCRRGGTWNGDPKAVCGAAASYFWYAMGPFMAARDVLTLLKADIPISTAVDNTSRFPFLSPSGALTPDRPAVPDRKVQPDDAQIIDGGYFENEGIMSAMEVARWLRTYGPGLIGRPVYPIVVQATSDADSGKEERDIARCGNRLPLNPWVANAATRGSQFLVPLAGLTAVRSGHSRALLQQALEDFCDEGGQQAFFHFYLYDSPDFEVPLNWSLSEAVADFIWDDAIAVCGNAADAKNLVATLRLDPDAWKPKSARPTRGKDRTIYSCTNAPVLVKMPDLPRLAGSDTPE
jgi:hypothetical protein